MADLSKFWRKQRAIATCEFDQKSMLAREMIHDYFQPEDDEKLRGIINHFSSDHRVTISLMGVLAQVGLCALAMDDSGTVDDLNGDG